MCGVFLTSVWWIFPVIGFLMCLAFMLLASRRMATGRRCGCMGGTMTERAGQAGDGANAQASH